MHLISSGDILFIKDISAFGAEFRGLGRIGRFPAALVALIDRCAGGLLRAALCAELTLVHRAAGAGPAFVGGLGRTAFGAELADCRCAANTFPSIFRFRLFSAAFRTEFSRNDISASAFPSIFH